MGTIGGSRGVRLTRRARQVILHKAARTILTPHHIYNAELTSAAGQVLFQLSAYNFDIVFSRIKAKIGNLVVQQSEEDPQTSGEGVGRGR